MPTCGCTIIGVWKRLPDVPSAKDEGVENYIVRLWYGILAPTGTPANLISRWNAEIVKAIQSADVKKRYRDAALRQDRQGRQYSGPVTSDE